MKINSFYRFSSSVSEGQGCISAISCLFSNAFALSHHLIVFRVKNCRPLQLLRPNWKHLFKNTLNLYVIRSIAQTLASFIGQVSWQWS